MHGEQPVEVSTVLGEGGILEFSAPLTDGHGALQQLVKAGCETGVAGIDGALGLAQQMGKTKLAFLSTRSETVLIHPKVEIRRISVCQAKSLRSHVFAYKMCVPTLPSRLNRTPRSRRAGPPARQLSNQPAWETLPGSAPKGG